MSLGIHPKAFARLLKMAKLGEAIVELVNDTKQKRAPRSVSKKKATPAARAVKAVSRAKKSTPSDDYEPEEE